MLHRLYSGQRNDPRNRSAEFAGDEKGTGVVPRRGTSHSQKENSRPCGRQCSVGALSAMRVGCGKWPSEPDWNTRSAVAVVRANTILRSTIDPRPLFSSCHSGAPMRNPLPRPELSPSVVVTRREFCQPMRDDRRSATPGPSQALSRQSLKTILEKIATSL